MLVIVFMNEVNRREQKAPLHEPVGMADSFYHSKEYLPVDLPKAKLKPLDLQYMRGIVEKFDIELPREIVSFRSLILTGKPDVSVAFSSDGSYEVYLARTSQFHAEQISSDRAKSIAYDAIRHFGLDQEVDLTLDSISLESEAGSSKDGEGAEGAHVTQTMVHFKQLINGIPIITPGVGEIGISINNDGSATRVQSSIRPVEMVRAHPRLTTEMPPEEGSKQSNEAKQKGYEQLLAKGLKDFLATLTVKGSTPVQYTTVPGTTEIGYEVRDDEATLSIRRGIEVDFGSGFHMRYWITVPIE